MIITFHFQTFMFHFAVVGVIGCLQALEVIKIATDIGCILQFRTKTLLLIRLIIM